MANSNEALRTFEARIWEKAEHWYFYATIEATDETEARKQLAKEYPRRSYSITYVR
jgi:hypothetical protein